MELKSHKIKDRRNMLAKAIRYQNVLSMMLKSQRLGRGIQVWIIGPLDLYV
jgi:hypothetical protein